MSPQWKVLGGFISRCFKAMLRTGSRESEVLDLSVPNDFWETLPLKQKCSTSLKNSTNPSLDQIRNKYYYEMADSFGSGEHEANCGNHPEYSIPFGALLDGSKERKKTKKTKRHTATIRSRSDGRECTTYFKDILSVRIDGVEVYPTPTGEEISARLQTEYIGKVRGIPGSKGSADKRRSKKTKASKRTASKSGAGDDFWEQSKSS